MNPHHHETNPHFVRPSQDDLPSSPQAGPTERARRHRHKPTPGPPPGPPADRFHRWPEQQTLPSPADRLPRWPEQQTLPSPADRLHRWPEQQIRPSPVGPTDSEPRPVEALRGGHAEEPSRSERGRVKASPVGHASEPSRSERSRSERGRVKALRGSEAAVGRGGAAMAGPGRTKATTWFGAIFCLVLWVVVILGGLAVLTVYLVFRPKSPRFEVSSATLNAAYLDMGYLLNADVSLLANFTNPNRKVSVEFGRMFVELYYGRTLVATQHLDPFTARRGRNTFASLHMVTSQVRLHEVEVQRMKRQSLNNALIFQLKGYFRARSNFGSLIRYSYWLHSTCTLMLTRPPAGVLLAKRCNTDH